MNSFSLIPLNLGIFMLSGLFFGLLASRLGLPRVAAYVIAGMIFSPDLLGNRLNIEVGPWAEPLTTVALGIIAYLIGGSITAKQIQKMGKIVLGTALGESLGAVLFVFCALMLLASDKVGITTFQMALAFAAIATSTAPAGTIAVLHQYRASGPVSSILLGVVALDDALGIIVFSLVLVVTTGETLSAKLGLATFEIGGALVLGAFAGWGLKEFATRVHTREMRLPLVFGGILLSVGLAEIWRLSPLLTAMAMGFSSRYFLGSSGDRLVEPIEFLEELVFIIFFTIGGAHFEIKVFFQHLDLIGIYFIARIIGKYVGASLGAMISGAPPPVTRWLGLGLVPQAGVAIGLVLTLSHKPVFHDVATMMVNVILATTLLFELVGPLAAYFALRGAGEFGVKRKRRKF
jgi:Kef-type K+ transport system membrane component KefB